MRSIVYFLLSTLQGTIEWHNRFLVLKSAVGESQSWPARQCVRRRHDTKVWGHFNRYNPPVRHRCRNTSQSIVNSSISHPSERFLYFSRLASLILHSILSWLKETRAHLEALFIIYSFTNHSCFSSGDLDKKTASVNWSLKESLSTD